MCLAQTWCFAPSDVITLITSIAWGRSHVAAGGLRVTWGEAGRHLPFRSSSRILERPVNRHPQCWGGCWNLRSKPSQVDCKRQRVQRKEDGGCCFLELLFTGNASLGDTSAPPQLPCTHPLPPATVHTRGPNEAHSWCRVPTEPTAGVWAQSFKRCPVTVIIVIRCPWVMGQS